MSYKMAIVILLSNFIRRKLPLVVDVMLRVPTVFVMDVLINYSAVESSTTTEAATAAATSTPGQNQSVNQHLNEYKEWSLPYAILLSLRFCGKYYTDGIYCSSHEYLDYNFSKNKNKKQTKRSFLRSLQTQKQKRHLLANAKDNSNCRGQIKLGRRVIVHETSVKQILPAVTYCIT